MKLEFLSPGLRRELCNEIISLVKYFEDVYDSLDRTGEDLFQSALGEFNCIPNHQVTTSFKNLVYQIDRILLESEFHRVLTFLEILMRQMSNHLNNDPRRLKKSIQGLFEKHGAAYRLVIHQDKPVWFYQCDSEENAKATVKAIETLHEGGFNGATKYLRDGRQIYH